MANIAFYVEGELLSSVDAGGGRLGEAAIEWTPPGPGTYTIQAIATNTNGSAGAPASSVIHITGEPAQPTASVIPPTPAVDVTDTPTITVAGTATQVLTPTQLPQTSTATFPPPTVAPSATAATLPPSFSFLDVDPDAILTEGPGCPSYSRTTTVTAVVVDPGGISSVLANWSIGSESGQVVLTFVGSDTYEGLIGPVNTTGMLSITVVAQDQSGNTSQDGPVQVDVQNCIT